MYLASFIILAHPTSAPQVEIGADRAQADHLNTSKHDLFLPFPQRSLFFLVAI